MTLRVVIADDEALVRNGLRLILGSSDDVLVVAEARDGAEAHRQVREHQPDVLLLDLRMPGFDGIEATRRITADGLRTAIIILTTFDLDEHVSEALRAGAAGFLLKDIEPRQLIDAVRAVASGTSLLTPGITRRLVEQSITASTRPAHVVAALGRLTEREHEVLLCLAEGQSNDEIARRLHLSVTTVKTHVARVLDKLRLRDRVHAVVFAYEYGLVRPGGLDG